ncbi:thiosulfate reductase cytochrome b subunit [Paraburkholderia silvatlantica]|uniref:Thiosulfate reductase cytochrome b subunit n=1 Tax=Paraburkholderia silvatlantica TaxID=321895 RepID=A0A2V4UF65_9BURK|nr:cytochrome b/b6 domain-containing protein [Paraburkholderia silvatlantica]PYE16717.1 thiosulfate reductase cytochrome b subunit [Paraburkholderia silvatlantica]
MSHTTIHPGWVRIFHWINAATVIAMCLSGWQVYDASPVFRAIRFPASITLGGWLGGALLWHFALMWVLVANVIVYLGMGLVTGRLRNTLLPVGVRAIARDMLAALQGKLRHEDLSQYNAVQKSAYLLALADLVLLVLSGLAIWKPVQFPVLAGAMGGFDNARVVHFVAMAVIVAFLAVHLAMVALVPRSLLAMIRGR